MTIGRFCIPFAAVAALFLPAAQAPEKVVLKQNLVVNQTWKMTMSTHMDMKLKITTGEREQDMDQRMDMSLGASNTPLAVSGGAPTRLRLVFDPDCRISMRMTRRTRTSPSRWPAGR